LRQQNGGNGVRTDNRIHVDVALAIQNDSYNNILKFGTDYLEHPV